MKLYNAYSMNPLFENKVVSRLGSFNTRAKARKAIQIEIKHSDVYVDVYTVKNLALEEAVKLFKKYSNVEFNDLLSDYYLENVETKVDDDSLWNILLSFQKEVNKMPTSEIKKLQEAMNRLKKENLTDNSQHNKDVLTLLNYLTKELS